MKKSNKSNLPRRVGLSFLVLSLVSGLLNAAQPPLPESGALNDYVEYALLYNPRIAAARSDLKAQRGRASYAFSLPDPMLMSRYGTQNGFSIDGIGVSQMLMFPTKIFTARRMELRLADRDEAGLLQVRLEVYASVTEAYASVYSAVRMRDILSDTMELLQLAEETATVMYTAGSARQSDLLRLQIELAGIEDAIASQELKMLSYKEMLAALLNVSDSRAIQIDVKQALAARVDESDAIIVQRALANNYALKMMESGIEAAGAGVSMARQQYLPDIELSAEYMRDAAMGGSLGIGLNFKLPLWIRKNRAGVRIARHMEQSMQHELEEMTNMVRSTTMMQLNEYRDALRKMKLYTDVLVPQARQLEQLTRTDYRTGAARILDLIEAQRKLLELEERLISEELRVQKSEARLMLMMGVRK